MHEPIKHQSLLGLIALFLVAGLYVLAPFNRWFELVSFVALVTGTWALLRYQTRQVILAIPGVWLFAGLFAAFWVPAALSLPDAAKWELGLGRLLGHLRFLIVGIVIVWLYQRRHIQTLMFVMSGVLFFWAFDAFYEVVMDRDWLDRPRHGNRVNGPFDVPKLGYYTALLFLPVIVWVGQRSTVLAGVLLVVASSMVLISADRGGWVHWFWTLGIPGGLCLFLWPRKALRYVWMAPLVAVIGITLYHLHGPIKQRFDHSLAAIVGGVESFKDKEARGYLFETAGNMFSEHPINGIGFRGFRYAYNDYVPTGREVRQGSDQATGKSTGHAHAHSVFLTFVAEMGLMGVVGYILLLSAGFVGVYLCVQQKMWVSAAWWSSYLSSIFPLNSTLDIGASSYGIVVWYLLAMAIASSRVDLQSRSDNA